MSDIQLIVQWRTALVQENGEAYYFPNRMPLYFRDKYAVSTVYRWRIMRVQGEPKETIYIGEAEDLVQRIQRVLTPPKNGERASTNQRLNKIFHEYLLTGRKIVLDVADIQEFTVNGIRFDTSSMRDRFKRRTLENLLLVLAQHSEQFELLNIVVEPLAKAERLLKRLKPHQLREILRKYAPDISEPPT